MCQSTSWMKVPECPCCPRVIFLESWNWKKLVLNDDHPFLTSELQELFSLQHHILYHVYHSHSLAHQIPQRKCLSDCWRIYCKKMMTWDGRIGKKWSKNQFSLLILWWAAVTVTAIVTLVTVSCERWVACVSPVCRGERASCGHSVTAQGSSACVHGLVRGDRSTGHSRRRFGDIAVSEKISSSEIKSYSVSTCLEKLIHLVLLRVSLVLYGVPLEL